MRHAIVVCSQEEWMKLAGLICLAAWGGSAQTASTPPSFEVASIRASQAAGHGGFGPGFGFRRDNVQVSPNGVTMRAISLKAGIAWAYHVMDYQVSGPDWMGFERFDIVAKAAEPVSSDQLREMMQTLLADRFKMAVHRQSKETAAYVLVQGKNGTKLHESTTEGESSIQAERARMSVTVERTPVSQLVDLLSAVLRAPVLDETGLKGKYDITVNAAKYAPGDRQAGDPPLDPMAMIMTALQEELGLKLESKKLMLDLVVVDHVEKAPTEN
jgi:uncharacterized protein (TIGR03435 family)